MKKCENCGEEIPYGKYCNSCRLYFNSGGVIYPLPEKGTVGYTEDDKVICHVCGKAYTKIAEHVKAHSMSFREYINEFDLSLNDRLTSIRYHDKMSSKAISTKTYEANFTHNIGASKKGGINSKKNMSEARKVRNGKIWTKNFSKEGEVNE